MSVQSLQKPQASAFLSVTAASVTHTKEETKTEIVHAGFTLGSQLPAVRNPGYREGPVLGFVAYRVTTQVTYRTTTNHSFCVSQPRPRAKNPVRDLFDRSQGSPASAMLFRQTTTYRVTTTITVLYFDFVCWQGSGSPHGKNMAPAPKPLPAQTPKHAAEVRATAPAPAPATAAPAATLKPVETSRKSDPSDWLDLPGVAPKIARYELFDMEKKNKWQPVQVALKDSPKVREVTPQELAPNGSSFTAVNEDNIVESIPLDQVKSFSVLSA